MQASLLPSRTFILVRQGFRFAARLFLFAALMPRPCPAEPEALCSDIWVQRMRQPWTLPAQGFIREWLVVGEFPRGAPADADDGSCSGCDVDYLAEHGGESAIRPEEGLAHARPDGSTARWFRTTADQSVVDLKELLGERPTDNAIAYAYATVVREEAGPAILAVGSDDGVMVWVNGQLVHRNVVGRALRIDNDRIPVDFRQGTNTLLLKIENGKYGWGFACRILDAAADSPLPQTGFEPSLQGAPNAAELVVQTDGIRDPRNAVDVAVVRPGGEIVAARTVPRGETASFATADWPDGPCEVRCTLALPYGKTKVRHLSWFKGDATAAVARLLAAGDQARGDAEADLISAMLADLVRDRLGDRTNEVADADVLKVHSALMEFAELELEKTGAGSRSRPYGFVRLAYRDDVDGSPQFGKAYLPPGYDPAQKWPLVIYLHGYSPENPVYVRCWAIDARHHDRSEDYGTIYLEPHGRGNTGYDGIGEQDVLRCIEMARQRFAVDPDRIYLTGESMGGGGTWRVGPRHPGLFAAIAPIFGGNDYLIHATDEELAKLSPLDRLLNEQGSTFAQVESLLTTPVFVNHGDADHIVAVQNSRYAVRQLQRWGYDVRYREQPGGGHFDNDHWPGIMTWLLEHRLRANPRHVRLRAARLDNAAAHWVQVERRADPFAFMRVDAEFAAPNVLRLDTENVLALVLSPGGDLVDAAKPLTVVWNENDVRTVQLQDGKATLYAPDFRPAPLMKRPGIEGPMVDVETTPFAIVAGTTSPDPQMRKLCERHAQNLAYGWEDWQKHPPRFFRDVDLAAEDLAAYSLILVGGPEENAATRKLAESLPLRVQDRAVTIDGRSFDAPDAAVQMVYPHPRNPDRYVLVVAATSPKGMFYAANMPREFDFCIQDGRQADRDQGRPAEKVRIACGRFDGAWRLADEYLFAGDPAIRAASPRTFAPPYMDAGVETNELFLSDVLESRAVQTFWFMQRDVNAYGQPLTLGDVRHERGLGVEPWSIPGSADWDLSAGDWQTLRATIGLEFNDPAEYDEEDIENVNVRFTVKGDGQELYRSEPFGIDSPPQEIEIPVAGVKTLTLVVHNEANWSRAVKSADWAVIRLCR